MTWESEAMLFRKRRPAPPVPRANHARIAVLEHDLLGIEPEAGTAAAVTIALRKAAANCMEHQAVETTTLGSPGPVGLCARCGCTMVQDAEGEWVKA